MGRGARTELIGGNLFDDLPDHTKSDSLLSTIQSIPSWSVNKSRLVEEYIKLYQHITFGGVFIDGFSAPQRHAYSDELWTAKRIIEIKPEWISHFYLCDIDPEGVRLLRDLKAKHEKPGRRINVFEGDFNVLVDRIFGTRRIRPRTPCFAFLDQRTTQCHWSTVMQLSNWRQKRRIEILYFFPTSWIGRVMSGSKEGGGFRALDLWWGRRTWKKELSALSEKQRVELMSNRFRNELGYNYVQFWPVFKSMNDNRQLYHLIHASDHPEARKLMRRAYIKIWRLYTLQTRRESGQAFPSAMMGAQNETHVEQLSL